jgi:hypothetical protein
VYVDARHPEAKFRHHHFRLYRCIQGGKNTGGVYTPDWVEAALGVRLKAEGFSAEGW